MGNPTENVCCQKVNPTENVCCQKVKCTHLDAVSAQEAKELEEEVRRKYSNPTIYPKVRIQHLRGTYVYVGIGLNVMIETVTVLFSQKFLLDNIQKYSASGINFHQGSSNGCHIFYMYAIINMGKTIHQ